MYALCIYYTILYNGLEYPWMWVSTEGPGTNPLWTLRDDCIMQFEASVWKQKYHDLLIQSSDYILVYETESTSYLNTNSLFLLYIHTVNNKTTPNHLESWHALTWIVFTKPLNTVTKLSSAPQLRTRKDKQSAHGKKGIWLLAHGRHEWMNE